MRSLRDAILASLLDEAEHVLGTLLDTLQLGSITLEIVRRFKSGSAVRLRI